MSPEPETVIPRVVSATINALEAAAATAEKRDDAAGSESRSVKRVVLTSSSTAAFISRPGVEGVRVDESTSTSSAPLHFLFSLWMIPFFCIRDDILNI